jgi:hypothetical protein
MLRAPTPGPARGRTCFLGHGLLSQNVPTQPQILITRLQLTNGQFSVEVNGMVGPTYSLWRRKDLTSGVWEPVTNASAQLNGFTLDVIDPTPELTQMFYQVRAQ